MASIAEKPVTFVEALAAAQSEMDNAALNKTNPHFKSKYADLAGVRAATLPILTKHGFAVIQTITVIDGAMYLCTELAHKSGESRSSLYPIASGTPQQQGSAITYARRYSWSAMTGIASEEDDDGNAGSGAKPKPKSAGIARSEGGYPILESEVRGLSSLDDIEVWLKQRQDAIEELPTSWAGNLLKIEVSPKLCEAIDACEDAQALKNIGVQIGRIMADWSAGSKAVVRNAYEKRLAKLGNGKPKEQLEHSLALAGAEGEQA